MTIEDTTGNDVAVESAETEETTPEETVAEVSASETATDVETPGVDAEPDPFKDVVSLDAEADEADPESDEAETEETAEGEEAAEEELAELVEFNFGGNKLEVPKGSLTPELEAKVQSFSDDLWSDYTKKAQANADEAKSVTADREAVAKLTTLNGEALQTYSKGLQLRQEIEQLSAVDMQAEWQSNPDRARQLSDLLSAKQAEFQNIVDIVGQQEQALDGAQQEELVRRTESGKASLDRSIKDFSTKIAPEVVEYVVKGGMSQAEADKWATNPLMTTYAYKAMMYDRMQAAPKKAKSTPAQAKPVKAVKSSAKATNTNRDPAKMTDAQFRKEIGL